MRTERLKFNSIFYLQIVPENASWPSEAITKSLFSLQRGLSETSKQISELSVRNKKKLIIVGLQGRTDIKDNKESLLIGNIKKPALFCSEPKPSDLFF